MAMMPLAPVAAAVEEDRLMGASSATSMDPMEPMAPTAAVAPEAASATVEGAAVVATADLAVVVVVQGRSGLSSVALMEEMVDLAAAQASASAPTLIRTALPETRALSAEVVTAVAVAVVAEPSEAPSSMTAVRLSSAIARLLVTMWTGGRVASPMTARTGRAGARMPARRSSL